MSSELPVWGDLTRDERLAIVKPLWLDGKSAGDIALGFFGATRSAVIGLVHRAKLGRAAKRALPNPRKRKTPQVKPPKPPRAEKPKLTPRLTGPQAEPPPPRDLAALDHAENCRPPLPGCEPVILLKLPNKEKGVCRFPVVGGFCGQPCDDDIGTCDGHLHNMFTPEGVERILARRRKANARGRMVERMDSRE